MATALTERRADPVAVIRQNLQQMAPEFKAALPAHVSVEKFTRVAMTAVQNQPDLAHVDRHSLFGAIVRLAQDGLLPDGREAAIVKFGDKAQAMPMIAGILKKIRQSGEVAYVSAQVVHEADHFVWKLGFEEDVEHAPPALDQLRGKPIGAYATAVLKDGSRLLEVMSLEEIEKVRSVSRSKGNGPWVTWWGEMARKTVMRRLSKRLPMSSDLDDAFERDETLANAERVAAKTAPSELPRGHLDALEAQIAAEPSEANDTGEGRSTSDHGEAFVTTPDELIAKIKKRVRAEDVNSLVASWSDQIAGMSEDDRADIAAAQTQRVVEIKGQPHPSATRWRRSGERPSPLCTV